MLCPNCVRYTWQSTAGSCEHCQAATPNYYNKLCTACSTNLDECEICRTNMGTKSSCSGSTGQASGWVLKKNMKDNGGKATLKVGEELEITLDETRGKEWFTGYAHDSSLVSETQRTDFLQGQNYNQGCRTIKFKAKSVGTTTLEIDEWQMRWDYSHYGSSGYVKDKKTGTGYKITITVK